LNYLVSSFLSFDKLFAKVEPKGRNPRILFSEHEQHANSKAFTNQGIQEIKQEKHNLKS